MSFKLANDGSMTGEDRTSQVRRWHPVAVPMLHTGQNFTRTSCAMVFSCRSSPAPASASIATPTAAPYSCSTCRARASTSSPARCSPTSTPPCAARNREEPARARRPQRQAVRLRRRRRSERVPRHQGRRRGRGDVGARGRNCSTSSRRCRCRRSRRISGPCLGGGLELALACDYRLVFDKPGTQLGLPEVELGLLPGWGGTQRLPRVVGLERALQVILGGKRLNAREAFRWGLADALAATEAELRERVRQLVGRAIARGQGDSVDGLPLRTWRQRLPRIEPASAGACSSAAPSVCCAAASPTTCRPRSRRWRRSASACSRA